MREDSQPSAPPWRNVLEIHPAANLFRLMSETDPVALKDFGENIKKNGLVNPIDIGRHDGKLWDGRNRLDAMQAAGILVCGDTRTVVIEYPDGRKEDVPVRLVDGDPYEHVLSANIHRRHLTAEQKRKVIADLVKAQPEKSDRQIAATVKVDHKTVGSVRAEVEGRGEIPHVETRTDTKGRKQPARKKRRTEGDFRRDVAGKKAADVPANPDLSRTINDCVYAVKLAVERALRAKRGDAEHRHRVFVRVRQCLGEMEKAWGGGGVQ